MFHDSLGGAANEQACHSAAAVRADYDKVHIEVVRHRDNFVKRVSHADIRLYLDPAVQQLLFDLCQSLPRLLLSGIQLRFDLMGVLLSPGKWSYHVVRYLKDVQQAES